jgi:Flp pilus assembly protein TadG
MAVQLIVVLVPVIFGLIGFAVDLGTLYTIRSELKTAANAMAVAAAQRLIGTGQGLSDATVASHLAVDNSTGFGDKYNFGGTVIGDTSGFLTSNVPDPSFFSTLQDALAATDATGGGGSSDARHARVTITADAPLTFWRFLTLGLAGKTTISASAVAGISAPLCTACTIEAFAVPALDSGDSTDFGYVQGTVYTLAYNCTGPFPPGPLPNTVRRIDYLLLNRLDTNATVYTDETTQLFRMGANGLPGNHSNPCFTLNADEVIWATALPLACALNRPPAVLPSAICGLSTRVGATAPSSCSIIPDYDTLASIYPPDTDSNQIDDYSSYTGNGRRVITIPIVDVLNPTGNMRVLGFRQFLVEPSQGQTNINPNDVDARFGAMYIGSVAPVRQGRFDGCQVSSGPGKVVLHQ